MKTISDYTIYCTESQTKKALELGAPIERDGYEDRPYVYIDGAYLIPTAEQMIGFLEGQGIAIDVNLDNTGYKWSVWENRPHNVCEKLRRMFPYHLEMISYDTNYPSRPEATLAAIDAALEYLITNKK